VRKAEELQLWLGFRKIGKGGLRKTCIVYYDGRNIKAYIGGSGNDTFVFAAGFTLPSGTSIDGRQGQDTLDFSAYENARDVTLTAVDEYGFSGKQAAIPGGFAGIDRIIGSLAVCSKV
jgi:hypothetical protein